MEKISLVSKLKNKKLFPKDQLKQAVVSAAVEQSYLLMSSLTEVIVNGLENLLLKIKATKDDEKRKAHEIGFMFGLNFIKELGEGLINAHSELSKELNSGIDH